MYTLARTHACTHAHTHTRSKASSTFCQDKLIEALQDLGVAAPMHTSSCASASARAPRRTHSSEDKRMHAHTPACAHHASVQARARGRKRARERRRVLALSLSCTHTCIESTGKTAEEIELVRTGVLENWDARVDLELIKTTMLGVPCHRIVLAPSGASTK